MSDTGDSAGNGKQVALGCAVMIVVAMLLTLAIGLIFAPDDSGEGSPSPFGTTSSATTPSTDVSDDSTAEDGGVTEEPLPPPTPEEPPSAIESTPAPPPPPPPVETSAAPEVYYSNCTEVRNAGAAPIRRGDPGYSGDLDRDGDGVACES
jgi:hypothetical protein